MKNMIAMILVGGRGTRLGDITKTTAKPAVSFGAKYRLIDFTLSNISNSDITTCGIVTQYEPFELMNYIGSGASWDLDYLDGGIKFLTPYSRYDDVLWQKGTAHAVKQYYRFIKDLKPDYVLILSGDHIYKLNYNLMLNEHISKNAEVTIAATKVNIKEASRFGILEISNNGKLISFEEKPNQPKSTLASMGVYIFSYQVLEAIFSDDNDNELVDFGRNIIPYCLRNEKDIYVYQFNDYWKDVGTLESLYEANMDLIEDQNFLGLNSSKEMPIFSKSLNLPPHIIKETGQVVSSIIADGAIISGFVKHSTIAYQVEVGVNSKVEDAVILPNVKIGENVKLKNVIVNKDLVIPDNYQAVFKELILLTEDNLLEVGEHHE